MAWRSLLNTVLAGTKREQEIAVENRSGYDQWLDELYSEIEVFVKRVNGLNLEEAEDRDQFYEFIDKFSSRMEQLRARSETSHSPAEVLIGLEELIELLQNTSAPVAVYSLNVNESAWEKKQRQQREKKRERDRIERVRSDRENVANQVENLNKALDTEV